MTEEKFWLVHFYVDKEDKYGETEELCFPTDLTRKNITDALNAAEQECEINGYLFICLDLMWNDCSKFYSFPRDLMKIK